MYVQDVMPHLIFVDISINLCIKIYGRSRQYLECDSVFYRKDYCFERFGIITTCCICLKRIN